MPAVDAKNPLVGDPCFAPRLRFYADPKNWESEDKAETDKSRVDVKLLDFNIWGYFLTVKDPDIDVMSCKKLFHLFLLFDSAWSGCEGRWWWRCSVQCSFQLRRASVASEWLSLSCPRVVGTIYCWPLIFGWSRNLTTGFAASSAAYRSSVMNITCKHGRPGWVFVSFGNRTVTLGDWSKACEHLWFRTKAVISNDFQNLGWKLVMSCPKK